MSKIICLLSLLLSIFFSPPTTNVKAESVYKLNESEIYALLDEGGVLYARPPKNGVYMFSDAECSDKLFELPATFYLKVLSYSADSCKTVYCYEDFDYARAVIGFVKTEQLSFVDNPPTGRSFPNVFLEFEGNGNFYKNNRFDSYYPASDSVASSDTFFYGYFSKGAERYCYVLKNGKFGYFSADVFKNIELPVHADAMPKERVTVPEPPLDTGDSNNDGLLATDSAKAVFVAVTCVVSISAVYLIFLPKKKKEPILDEYAEDYQD